MAFDHERVKQSALALKQLLAHYAVSEPSAATVERELLPLINAILDGSARLPIEWVPSGRYFLDSSVGEIEDLANAYYDFRALAEGNVDVDVNEETKKFFHRLETDPKFVARMASNELVWWEKIWSFFSRMPGWQTVWKVWVRLKRFGRRLRGDWGN